MLENKPIYARLPFLLETFGLKRSTVYFWIRKGNFPPPYKVGDRCSLWDIAEVEEYLRRRGGGGHSPEGAVHGLKPGKSRVIDA